MTNIEGMEIIEITKEQLEKLYQSPPLNPEKETDFQRAYRMGKNSLILELINKDDANYNNSKRDQLATSTNEPLYRKCHS